jgi:hypothetical protein
LPDKTGECHENLYRAAHRLEAHRLDWLKNTTGLLISAGKNTGFSSGNYDSQSLGMRRVM